LKQDRRRAVAVDVIERSERQPPALRAVLRVREQTIVAKEHVHVLAIGYRTRRRGRIRRLIALEPWPRRLPPAQDFTSAALEGKRVQLAALVDHLFASGICPRTTLRAGQIDPIAPDHR